MRAALSVMAALTAVAAVTAQGARPLPAPEALYKAARDNLVRAEQVAHLYGFTERRTDLHGNPFGRIGTDGYRVFEVYPSATRRLTYRRLIERSGVRLSDDELAEQDRQYRARVAEVRREAAGRTAEEQVRQEAETRRARARRQRRVEDVIDALVFKVERREIHQGTRAIVVSFVPKPGADPETREGRLATSFRGSIWIDEATSEVMRAEGTSIDDITFGFGLAARVGKGATASMTRQRVDGDVWMPTQVAIKGRGRAVVFRSLVLDYVVDWFDYRRFDGTSDTPFFDSRIQSETNRRP